MRRQKHLLVAVKIAVTMLLFALAGNFIVNNLLNLNIKWAYGFFLVLSAVLAVHILDSTFSETTLGEKVKDTHSRVILILALITFLVIAYFPRSQGVEEKVINLIFFIFAVIVGALIAAPIMRKE